MKCPGLLLCVVTLLLVLGASIGNGQSTERKKTLKVTTLLNPPYVISSEDGDQSNYTGFLIDLLDEITELNGINYKIHLVADGRYGAKANDGQWTGMIGEVIRRDTDMAMADLTMTSERSKVIDFTVPFLSMGISMMVKRNDLGGDAEGMSQTSTAYLFLTVFAWETWCCILIAFLVISGLHYVAHKFTKDKEDGEGFAKEFSQSLSALTIGKTEASRSCSVRFLQVIWKLFTLFAIGLYLSSLTTAFLTRATSGDSFELAYAKSPESVIQDALDRGYPKIITIQGGSTQAFFKHSLVPEYQRLGKQLSSNSDQLVANSAEGFRKVKEGGYMFMLESMTNEYMTNRDCELQMLPQLVNNRGYAMAFPKNHNLLAGFNAAILRLQESSKIAQLKKKWWSYDLSGCNQEKHNTKSKPDWGTFSPVTASDISGLFYSLIGAAVVAVLAVSAEFILKRKRAKTDGRKSDRV